MPFRSKAQMRFLYSQHPEIAKRWQKETPNIKTLPARKRQYSEAIIAQAKRMRGGK